MNSIAESDTAQPRTKKISNLFSILSNHSVKVRYLALVPPFMLASTHATQRITAIRTFGYMIATFSYFDLGLFVESESLRLRTPMDQVTRCTSLTRKNRMRGAFVRALEHNFDLLPKVIFVSIFDLL